MQVNFTCKAEWEGFESSNNWSGSGGDAINKCWLTLSQTWNKETMKLKIILGEFFLRNNFMGNFDEAIDIKGSIIYEANVPPVKK